MSPAPKGNNYWQFRDKHGRNYKYTPEKLWDEFILYNDWIESTPLQEAIVIQRGIIENKGKDNEKISYTTPVSKMRAMSIKSFCLFADIMPETFQNYDKIKDFLSITTRIRDAIFSQKFEGSSANLLNPTIIARELGLKEQSENTNKNTIEYVNVSKQFPDKK